MGDPYKRDRRLGRWTISAEAMAEYPGCLEDIQRHVVILRAAPAIFADRVDFMGRSPDFDIVADGDEVPQYWPVMDGGRIQWHSQSPGVQ